MKSFAITLALCLFGLTSIASAHGGGVDGQGGHNNRRAGDGVAGGGKLAVMG